MEDVKLLDKIKAFLSVDGYGYGDCSCYGYGYGSGSGSGSCNGYGSGYGYGDGDGSGSGYGDGDGDGGLSEINGHSVFLIDDVATILCAVHQNIARGYILRSDLTMEPCCVVKGNRMFAHGKTLREAMEALTNKMFEDMPEEERIAEFIKVHPDKDKLYSHQDLFDWHNRLTGSCEMGRKTFMKDHDLDMDGESTVTRFIDLTKNSYNGSVIRNLERAYNLQH